MQSKALYKFLNNDEEMTPADHEMVLLEVKVIGLIMLVVVILFV